MSPLPLEAVLQKPAPFRDGRIAVKWFSRIAQIILNQFRVIAGDPSHRIVELEVYFHGDGHPTPDI